MRTARRLWPQGCEIVGMVSDTAGLVDAVRSASARVIVCDLDSASRDTIESMRGLNRDEPRPVVMFVDRADPANIAAAMDAGVAAYVEGLSPGRMRSVIEVAVARFRAHQALRSELAEARSALTERKLVERTKGVLMQTRQMSEDEANQPCATSRWIRESGWWMSPEVSYRWEKC